jgi:CRP/FNR family transcriptional regulator, polysaccharide utilization system transcription regulator
MQKMANSFNRFDPNCLTCEFRSPMFNFLSREELQRVQDNRIHVIFKPGETIRKQGTFMSHVISVNSGMAKLYDEGIGNTNTILRIVKPTNFIGGPAIYLDQIHHFTVTALIETSVCFIDLNIFIKLLEGNKLFALEFMKDFSRNVLMVYKRLIALTHKQIPGRMADTLLYLFENVYENTSINHVISKQDLADLSVMSRDSAAKILKEFQDEGIIKITKDEFSLIDMEAIKRISKTG